MATATESGVLMHGESIHEESELENGCGCFHSFWSSRGKRRVTSDDDRWNLLPKRREHERSWLVTHLYKLKEASELVAGPKWKNLIRKIGAYFNNKKKKNLQYDSFNYTLNFDDGVHDDDEGGAALGFSSRFAPPVNDKPRSST